MQFCRFLTKMCIRDRWNGVHEWNFWDRSLVYAIDYFLNNGYAAKKLNDWRSAAVVS